MKTKFALNHKFVLEIDNLKYYGRRQTKRAVKNRDILIDCHRSVKINIT